MLEGLSAVVRKHRATNQQPNADLFFLTDREQLVLGKIAQLCLAALVTGDTNPACGTNLTELTGRPVAAGAAKPLFDFTRHFLSIHTSLTADMVQLCMRPTPRICSGLPTGRSHRSTSMLSIRRVLPSRAAANTTTLRSPF